MRKDIRVGLKSPLQAGYARLRGLLLVLLPLLLSCASIAGEKMQISGQQAIAHAEEIVRTGPHPPGSDAQRRVGVYLIEQLKKLGLAFETQTFTPLTPEGPLEMVNIWGVLPGSRPEVIILASHYDSKLFSDFTFVGANDGASSSGVILELARVLSQGPLPEYTYWFVFFDGEEALQHWTAQDSLYGSRHFVSQLQSTGQLSRIRAMILLDLIGGQPLKLTQEAASTAWLRRVIWQQAAVMGHSDVFWPTGQFQVEDDHVPFLNAGIPAVDLIDLSYPHWHRASDTIDKLSARNLEIVGNVVLASLPAISRHLNEMDQK